LSDLYFNDKHNRFSSLLALSKAPHVGEICVGLPDKAHDGDSDS